MAEEYTGDLADGTGTGAVTGTGNDEVVTLDGGEYWVSPSVETGVETISIFVNKYKEGTLTPTISYKTGATQSECEEKPTWTGYTVAFTSDGWIQIRLSN